MDMVYDRASIIVEEDRISNLPNEIIHHILSFLDLKYVIQTRTLSKKWKHIWTWIPHLNLNSRAFRTLPKFVKFVNDVLSHRNRHLEVSAVELSLRGAATQIDAVMKSIVDYAYSHNVRKLTLVWFWFNYEFLRLPRSLFSCHTLIHLTLATDHLNDCGLSIPNSAWDFPALETLNLSNMRYVDDIGDNKSLNLFSKCVNLKDLTLHQFSIRGLDIFNVCAPRLSNLTITDPYCYPKVFNVVAPQLESLTAPVMDNSHNFLQLSDEDLDSLEKVSLSMRHVWEKERYIPGLLDLFQKLCGAKFLILDKGIIEVLSAWLDQLADEPCPFNNLKCLKLKDHTPIMPSQVRNYFLESSPTATFIMDLPQKRSSEEVDKGTMAKKASNVIALKELQKISREEVPHKRSRHEADNGTMANTVEEEKQQTESLDEEKRMLEAKLFKQDEVIAEQKAMLEAMKVQKEKRMLEAKIHVQDEIITRQKAMLELEQKVLELEEKMQLQDKVIAEQKAMLEAMKLQNEKKMCKAEILRQDKIIAEQKAMLEAMKLQHEKIETELDGKH